MSECDRMLHQWVDMPMKVDQGLELCASDGGRRVSQKKKKKKIRTTARTTAWDKLSQMERNSGCPAPRPTRRHLFNEGIGVRVELGSCRGTGETPQPVVSVEICDDEQRRIDLTHQRATETSTTHSRDTCTRQMGRLPSGRPRSSARGADSKGGPVATAARDCSSGDQGWVGKGKLSDLTPSSL